MRPCKGRYRHVQQLAKSASQQFLLRDGGESAQSTPWNGGRGAYPGPLRALSARLGDGLGVASIWSHDIDLRVKPLFDPSIPRPDARLVHF